MRITISGPPGSGKTTVCNLLSKRLGMRCVISGQLFREMAKEQGLSLAEFGSLCEVDPKNDRALDDRIVEIARKNKDVILEGRLAAHMLHRHGLAALKVYLDADPKARAGRVAERERIPEERAEEEVVVREACEERRYHTYYDIDINDKTVYDLVIDTTRLTPDQVVERIAEALRNFHAKDAGER